ncbi:hypothetical protein CPB84DRAFT_1765743 [Gymnopilus junonius]|uniref:FAD-binding domain-containing protein n=1 Tax=Gymnopilus junonius TaxID=109634 RepID=A0A9P5TSN4_GYMJU|nr:hypothetical protein CPB84DRAFT_1765743 [Gymnopilus junonius]
MAADPIIISGAGPAGLILALSLVKQGVPVRVIDKEFGIKPGERGAGIMPRSLEVHRLLGILPDILNLATSAPIVRQYDPTDATKVISSGLFRPVKEPTPQVPYTNPVLLGQPYQERIFISHLEKLGVSVEFGSELPSFKQIDDFVTGEIIATTVRKTLGLSFLGETREGDNIVIADVKIKGQSWKWGSPATKMAQLRGSGQEDGIAQLVMAGAQVDVTKCYEGFYDITGRRDIVFEEVVWLSRYRPNIRMVDQVRVDRVFIAGDAAHCHSPAGAQFNLGWKLALVYKGFAPSTLLDTYAEERLPIIAEMLGKTTELLKQVMVSGDIKRGGELSQLGVNYRGSSIVYEDDMETLTVKGKGYNDASEVAARPGDRAPDAPGLADAFDKNKGICLYDVFSVAAHTILVFSDTLQGHSALFQVVERLPGATVQVVLILPKGSEAFTSESGVDEQFAKVLVDNDGHAYAGYHVDQASLAIIRPDGVVGARVLGVSGIERYFKGIFA